MTTAQSGMGLVINMHVHLRDAGIQSLSKQFDSADCRMDFIITYNSKTYNVGISYRDICFDFIDVVIAGFQ